MTVQTPSDLVDEMHKNNLCVDHHGFQDRRVSIDAFKQHRISVVDTTTRNTPISRHFEKILHYSQPFTVSSLQGFGLRSHPHCPSGRRNPRGVVRRVLQGSLVSQDDTKVETRDSDGEEDGGTQTFQMDDFHPYEFLSVVFPYCETTK